MSYPYNQHGYVIRLSEAALIQLCHAGLEAYAVRHQRTGPKVRLETFGLLWGHETRMVDGRTFYSVEMSTVDTSAHMKRDEVTPSREALEIKRDLMTSFWPHMEFLGDFHTHPWEDAQEIVNNRLHYFSDDDRNSIEDEPEFWSRQGYRVGLVLTIGHLKRASSRRHKRLDDGALEFTFGNYRLWLKGYVAYAEGTSLRFTTDDGGDLWLDCPALLGLDGEFTDFGRAVGGTGRKHRPGSLGLPQ